MAGGVMTKRNAPCVIVDDLPFKAPAGHTVFWRHAEGNITSMTIGCPCGCGSHHGARFQGPNAWGFDGNLEKPTGPDGHYHWHGHLVAGEYVEC